MIAKADTLAAILLEAGDTLVIHLEDRSTDFLTAIYQGLGYPVISGRIDKAELLARIKAYKRIFMLGHGSPSGLFGAGYLLGEEFGPALAEKPDGLYIWCHAEVYARRNKLSGLVSGMFISEVGEARMNGIEATQEEVDASNAAFSKAVRQYLDTGASPHTVRQCYTSATCKITQFNNERLYVFDKGTPDRKTAGQTSEEEWARNEAEWRKRRAERGGRRWAPYSTLMLQFRRNPERVVADAIEDLKKEATDFGDKWTPELEEYYREQFADEYVQQEMGWIP